MESELTNRLRMVKNVDKFLEILDEIKGRLYGLYLFNLIPHKIIELMDHYGIKIDFNFSLWRKLNGIPDLFNYLKISKKPALKEKWLSEILKRVPDLLDIYEETSQVFDKYKEILASIIQI